MTASPPVMVGGSRAGVASYNRAANAMAGRRCQLFTPAGVGRVLQLAKPPLSDACATVWYTVGLRRRFSGTQGCFRAGSERLSRVHSKVGSIKPMPKLPPRRSQ